MINIISRIFIPLVISADWWS